MGASSHRDGESQQSADAKIYVVTYVEVAPGSVAEAAALIEPWAEAERGADGNLRFEVVQRTAPNNQFAIVATWRDAAALAAGRASPAGKRFADRIAPLLISAIDDRVHTGLAIADGGFAPKQGAVCVVTHVDVPPPHKDACITLLEALVGRSREETGCVRFEVFQQTERPNHFSVVEVWRSQGDYESHIVASHTVTFRRALTPLSGALYDERLYAFATLR